MFFKFKFKGFVKAYLNPRLKTSSMLHHFRLRGLHCSFSMSKFKGCFVGSIPNVALPLPLEDDDDSATLPPPLQDDDNDAALPLPFRDDDNGAAPPPPF
ncbi:hypothetical protein E5676_scaffold606G00200 [Cucumis melo var. makuwa]|uniref:Uncharacterized protein n=1 Tax=Cucumis melo var. makuwa TaxID=1194695 RepID=A0A5D3C7K9_CUCMM|nr:hypothetical protein E6C27_scaffold90G00210 [Cucumis melo var. makuwa]TYK07148.1 hypothetical protein E5676_scaffold606G00200 [Cucumis melo var. makuwa]